MISFYNMNSFTNISLPTFSFESVYAFSFTSAYCSRRLPYVIRLVPLDLRSKSNAHNVSARARALNFYGAEFPIHSCRSLAISPQMYSYEFISRLLELSWSYRKCTTMDAKHTCKAIQRALFSWPFQYNIFFTLENDIFL